MYVFITKLKASKLKSEIRFGPKETVMGLFGSSGDTGGTGGGDFGSKLRTPSYSEDLTSDPAASSFGGGGSSSLDLAGGDLQKGLQIEQQKAELMSQVTG